MGYAHPVATKHRPLVAASAISSGAAPTSARRPSTRVKLLRSAAWTAAGAGVG